MWEGDSPVRAGPAWTSLAALACLDEAALRASCRRRRFTRGEVVFHEGDPAGAFHLLDKGRVAVRLTTPIGDVATIDVLQQGDTFGEQSLVDGVRQRTATVTALERVETLSLDPTSFETLRTAHPGVDRFLLMVVSARLHSTSQQLLEALYVAAEVRILRCLCRLSAIFDTDAGQTIPMTQAEIASMTGVTRSTANRLLGQAQTDGLIRVGRGHIAIMNPTVLRHRAQLRNAPTTASG
jgi:CRP/FNR family transcriptional regulator, cyclic AMP receptor protein